ncbi:MULTISPECIES: hypothetical protein [unclassified Acinetobacter]|uniref:hypothetical protein n=1 Tax=unclassified Acinetobacter TaxID=196816 RepID=UPI001E30012E|nr:MULTISPECIES: hypothetical protein [unclassified Acinetobacter]MCD0188252.1 hypothetical protein [Acinetobacter sp. PW68]GJC31087.1 hypothetical protein KAM392_10660 [Acinetobacter sp. KAM392]GJC39544.1 hypothetical protein KAM395_10650 [Acinetobacter sp. KAM395]GJC53860.1 hypothetical protein KAM400_12710 [Acinetobacter sp. KAM400]GJC67774.1 hypothetical protein KAM405_10790 [Acinetobacter sp. KAM405]
MNLSSSDAREIFWLARYLTRIQYVCQQFPFKQNEAALTYAHAFCLPAFDAASLNELILNEEQPASFVMQLEQTLRKIKNLAQVFSKSTYAELKHCIQNACDNASYIGEVLQDCEALLDAEPQQIYLFFQLGQRIEQLDRQIRLKQSTEKTLLQLEMIVQCLKDLGWTSLVDAWVELKQQPDTMHFYHFSDHIQHLLSVD